MADQSAWQRERRIGGALLVAVLLVGVLLLAGHGTSHRSSSRPTTPTAGGTPNTELFTNVSAPDGPIATSTAPPPPALTAPAATPPASVAAAASVPAASATALACGTPLDLTLPRAAAPIRLNPDQGDAVLSGRDAYTIVLSASGGLVCDGPATTTSDGSGVSVPLVAGRTTSVSCWSPSGG